MNKQNINVAAWVSLTTTEGPGSRFAMWLQGCPFRCKGCCNQNMLEMREAHVMSIDQAFNLILKEKNTIEGVTFLGGEPMVQAKGLALLAKEIQNIGLSVMVFSGYKYEFLKKGKLPGVLNFLESTDILVDGLYRQDLPETSRRWIGSRNQKLYFLTKRYNEKILQPKKTKVSGAANEHQREMEIRFSSSNDKIVINGWPLSSGFQDPLIEHLHKEGIYLQRKK